MPVSDIDSHPELAGFSVSLKAIGYVNTAQFIGAAAASPDAMVNYLQTTPTQLNQVIALVAPRVGGMALFGAPRTYSLGARADNIKPLRAALMHPPALPVQLPARVDLVETMRTIRDQGQRGTCVAHAATAAAEQYFGEQGTAVDLSRQFLYWDCKQHDGLPDSPGTWISVAMDRLVTDGCCPEDDWKYVSTGVPGNESQNPPPAAAVASASQFVIPSMNQLAPTVVAAIKAELSRRRCVAFSIPVFNSWYRNAEVERTGEIGNPIPNEVNVGAHAMCLVGYEDSPDDVAIGGGVFYLRNSWGTTWASSPALANHPGYGTIPYSYINAYCLEAYSIG